PNETDEQFEETMTLMEEVGFEAAYTFIYSPRDGTPADKMKDEVPMEVKKERLQRLNELVNTQSRSSMEEYTGQVVKVLEKDERKKDEKKLADYTERNKVVNLVGTKTLIGKIVDVKITEARTWSLNGELVEKTVGVSE